MPARLPASQRCAPALPGGDPGAGLPGAVQQGGVLRVQAHRLHPEAPRAEGDVARVAARAGSRAVLGVRKLHGHEVHAQPGLDEEAVVEQDQHRRGADLHQLDQQRKLRHQDPGRAEPEGGHLLGGRRPVSERGAHGREDGQLHLCLSPGEIYIYTYIYMLLQATTTSFTTLPRQGRMYKYAFIVQKKNNGLYF